MSEVKFTDDELKSIQEISNKSNSITNRFGQLAIAKINLEKQSEQVEEEEFRLHEELENLKKEEQEILNSITEKYGPGTLDPQTGVFTPTTQVESTPKEN
jgi:archaellum component FlaC